ncbi:carboxypeptidase-like regulatory domain-containing protein [Streptomyces sp. NPDC006372]|uniref:carboxypeptidase-like regulatory domain-containing protein n=1 Tax=Streptomyces sp. NPDC006372 TaxID=3155599 RepID=UPI0033BBB781
MPEPTGLESALVDAVADLDVISVAALLTAAEDDRRTLEALAVERARCEADGDTEGAEELARRTERLERRRAAEVAEAQRVLTPLPEPVDEAEVVTGRVTDAEGRGVAGVTVEVRDAAGEGLATATTDNTGGYAVTVPAGRDADIVLRVVRGKTVLFEDGSPARARPGLVAWREIAVTPRGKR